MTIGLGKIDVDVTPNLDNDWIGLGVSVANLLEAIDEVVEDTRLLERRDEEDRTSAALGIRSFGFIARSPRTVNNRLSAHPIPIAATKKACNQHSHFEAA